MVGRPDDLVYGHVDPVPCGYVMNTPGVLLFLAPTPDHILRRDSLPPHRPQVLAVPCGWVRAIRLWRSAATQRRPRIRARRSRPLPRTHPGPLPVCAASSRDSTDPTAVTLGARDWTLGRLGRRHRSSGTVASIGVGAARRRKGRQNQTGEHGLLVMCGDIASRRPRRPVPVSAGLSPIGLSITLFRVVAFRVRVPAVLPSWNSSIAVSSGRCVGRRPYRVRRRAPCEHASERISSS